MRMQEMDRLVTWGDQLVAAGPDPVVLVNVFTVAPEDVEVFLEVWRDDAALMSTRSGFVDACLHRGTAGSTVFVNVARWESEAALRDAFTSPEFQRTLVRYPDSVVARPQMTTAVVRV